MLFTYKNCGCCKREMTNVKVLLNNISPLEFVMGYVITTSTVQNVKTYMTRSVDTYIDINN